MNCEIARRLIETNDAALDQHVLSCPACILRTHAPYYEAPAGLEQKIREYLLQEGRRGENSATVPWRWLAIAASVLLVASIAGNLALLKSRVAPRQVLADNVLSAHIRSLAGTHLIDIPSSDQHTVKPWFNGKLDFSPTVKEVDGFPLLGGRLEYFEDHAAAALIYGRNKHIVNLFTWPSPSPINDSSETRNGYHLESWWSDGMTYWAVSDINEGELHQFATLFRNR